MKFYNEEKIFNGYQAAVYKTHCGDYKKGDVTINSKKISVDIADNECKEVLGLSERNSLNDGEGMFFVFDNQNYYPFWMKDMNFPIDILWINDSFKIVGIEKNVSPDTYPQYFGAEFFSKYILEIPAFYSDRNNIKVGDKIIFSIN